LPVFLSKSDLSRDSLCLNLTNDLGQYSDASDVKWTIYSSSGSLISGMSLPAIKKSPGRYYAPWRVPEVSGSYSIVWEFVEWPECVVKSITESIYVLDPSSYSCLGFRGTDAPAPSTMVFVAPCWTSQNDLTATFKDDGGAFQDPYAVYWTLYASNGFQVYPRSIARKSSVGNYYAQTLIPGSGDFYVSWEWQDTLDSPINSMKRNFSAISSRGSDKYTIIQGCYPQMIIDEDPFCFVDASINLSGFGSSCGYSPNNPDSSACCFVTKTNQADCSFPLPPAPPVDDMSSCCSFEISRSVHIPSSVLPSSGAYTSQSSYQIGTSIRKVTYYIKYTRSAEGGRPAFRLMWSNGTEEVQETVLDIDVQNCTPYSQAQGLFQQQLLGPIPEDSNPIDFIIYATVPGGAKSTRLLAKEHGTPGTPGTIFVTMTSST